MANFLVRWRGKREGPLSLGQIGTDDDSMMPSPFPHGLPLSPPPVMELKLEIKAVEKAMTQFRITDTLAQT